MCQNFDTPSFIICNIRVAVPYFTATFQAVRLVAVFNR